MYQISSTITVDRSRTFLILTETEIAFDENIGHILQL